jgi:hypothetical protein
VGSKVGSEVYFLAIYANIKQILLIMAIKSVVDPKSRTIFS